MNLSKFRNLVVLVFAMLFTCNIYSVEIEQISIENIADGKVDLIDIDRSDTVGSLKDKIHEKLGIPRNRNRINLVVNGEVLAADNVGVWNLPGIHENKKMFMVLRVLD
jgi:hypothetical protein